MEVFKKSDEERSEILFNQLEKLAREREALVAERRKALEDPVLQQLFVSAGLAAAILEPGDHLLRDFQEKLKVKKNDFEQKEHLLSVQQTVAGRELQELTGPVIRKILEDLDSRRPRSKIRRNVIERKPGGFSMTSKLVVESNETGIAQVQKLIQDAIVVIGGMRLRPLREIGEKAEGILKQIAELDPDKISTNQISEMDYARREFLAPSK